MASSKTDSSAPADIQAMGFKPVQQWRQRLSALPPPSWEDAPALRLLVQVLVTVGICSLSVASLGVTDTSAWNLLAIPLSAAGAYWSWRSRRRRNIGMKLAIALGMLVALAFFLGRMLRVPGDTRIVLAELLIQLQVLHSFDLPRRKDLGYSTVIGLILIGVAATISQTLLFGPFLLLFLVVALPVLVLDYRARLGLSGPGRLSVGVAPRQLVQILAAVVVLGLVVFVAMPRLPGYQLQTFPVSGSIDVAGDGESSQIFNPGYVSGGGSGDQETADGPGSGSPETGPGTISTDFYYGFNQRINQNLRGEMTPQVVMRVRSQLEGFWRVMAFDRYTGQGWEVSRADATVTLNRSLLSYRYLPVGRAPQGPTREVVQTYTMVQDFQNLVPALYAPEEIYFPSEDLAMDAEGTIRAPGLLPEGLTYTIVSEVPLRDTVLLRTSPADYSDAIRQHYLQIPEAVEADIRAETERWLATAEEPLTTPYDKATFLAQVLQRNYTLDPEVPFFEEGEDLVQAFLFRYGGGTADQFSTTLTMMLRSIGIPARLGAGFGPGEFNPFTGFYIVRNTDAYALTEVYFPNVGWFYFDPIPDHRLFSPSSEQADPFGVLRQLWRLLEGVLPAPIADGLQQGLRFIARLVAGLLYVINRFGGQGWLRALWATAAGAGLVFLGWLSWVGWQRWHHHRRLNRLDPPEQVYQRLLTLLTERGYPKAPSQTPLEYAHALQHSDFSQADRVLQLVTSYVGWRYGGLAVDIEQLRSQLQLLRRGDHRRS